MSSKLQVVAGVILCGESVLAALCGPEMRNSGTWEFPGGKVEVGETPEAALARELFEELGVVVKVHESLGVSELGAIRLEAFAVTILSGQPTPLEHAELRWIHADELDRIEWSEADRPLLHSVRARLHR